MPKKSNTINKRIANYRILAGYTQEEAANALGMNKSTYARMERTGSPKPETLKKIAEVFNVSAELLLYGEFLVPKPEKTELHDKGLFDNKNFEVTFAEENLIKKFRNLSPKDREELTEYIEKLIEKHS